METTYQDFECGQNIDQDSFLGLLGARVQLRDLAYNKNRKLYVRKAMWENKVKRESTPKRIYYNACKYKVRVGKASWWNAGEGDET